MTCTGPTLIRSACSGSSAGSLYLVVHAVTGFNNGNFREQVAGLLGKDYSSSQISYDLRRLRLHGLIEHQAKANSYALTPEGVRVAVFYTKLQARLLAADQPPAPLELRRAFAPSHTSWTTTSPTRDLE